MRKVICEHVEATYHGIVINNDKTTDDGIRGQQRRPSEHMRDKPKNSYYHHYKLKGIRKLNKEGNINCIEIAAFYFHSKLDIFPAVKSTFILKSVLQIVKVINQSFPH